MATSEAPAMSAFALRNLEAKHEKILKELSRVAANRKCVDCDNIVRNLNHLDLRLGDPLLLALAAYANACFSCSAGSAVCDYIIRRFRLHRVWRPSVSLLFYFFRSHRLPLHSLNCLYFVCSAAANTVTVWKVFLCPSSQKKRSRNCKMVAMR